jgi:hypothetical protein
LSDLTAIRKRWGRATSSGRRLRRPYANLDEAEDDPGYFDHGEVIYERFVQGLQSADPRGYAEGFWGCHARNEAMLIGVGL